MFKRIAFVFLCCTLSPVTCSLVWGQTSQTATDYTARRIVFPLLDAPQPVPAASVSVSGNPGPQTYYYWIVSQGIAGASSPAGPFQLTGAPNTLTGSNFDAISWQNALGAVTYDVLRTTTPSMPFGTCNCAVATGLSTTSTNDQSNTLNAYTVNTLNAGSLTFTLSNESSAAGLSALRWRVNGLSVATLDSTGKLTPSSIGALSSLQLLGATSGTATLQPAAVAGGTHTLPNNTGTIAELNLAQTWTANQMLGSLIVFGFSDACISRSSANSIAFGNCTQADTSGVPYAASWRVPSAARFEANLTRLGSSGVYAFASSANGETGTTDTGISRIGPGQIAVGNGIAADSSGIVYSTTFRVLGTARLGASELLPNTGLVGFASGANGESSCCDTGISRGAPGVVAVGSGVQGDTTGFTQSGNTIRLNADFTLAANTSLQTIFHWTLPAQAFNWSFHCWLPYSQATSAVSDAFGIQAATNAATRIDAVGVVYTGPSASNENFVNNLTTTTATAIVTFTPAATATEFPGFLDGTIQAGASPPTVNIMASQSNSGDLLTIKAGAYCAFTP